jgi:hypothetical protein
MHLYIKILELLERNEGNHTNEDLAKELQRIADKHHEQLYLSNIVAPQLNQNKLRQLGVEDEHGSLFVDINMCEISHQSYSPKV